MHGATEFHFFAHITPGTAKFTLNAILYYKVYDYTEPTTDIEKLAISGFRRD
jgi:hypothetical protein